MTGRNMKLNGTVTIIFLYAIIPLFLSIEAVKTRMNAMTFYAGAATIF